MWRLAHSCQLPHSRNPTFHSIEGENNVATPEQTQEVVDIPTEEPLKAGPFTLDHTIFWAICLFGLLVAVMRFAVQGGVAWLGLFIFAPAICAIYYFLIHKKIYERGETSGLAMAYRQSSRQFRRFRGAAQGFSESPEIGELVGADSPEPRPKPIKQIGRVDFSAYKIPSGMLGWSWDHRYNTYSATILCHFSSFLSAGTWTQDKRRGGFAALLDSIAEDGSLIHRLSWRDQTFLGEYLDIAQNLEAIQKGANLTREECPNQAMVLENLARISEEDSLFHRTTMTVSIYAPDAKHEARSLGISIEEVLATQLEAFLSQALGPNGSPSPVGLVSARVLTYNALVMENRLALDPIYAQHLWQRWLEARDEAVKLSEQLAWPDNWDFDPSDHCVLGETVHKCSYIPQLAKRGMQPDQFWKIIQVPVRKTITVVYQMLPLEQGLIHAEVSRAAAASISHDRELTNKASKAVHEVAVQDARAREYEIATSQGRVGRLRCYVDLWGSTLDEVVVAQTKLNNAIVDARFRLQPLLDRQHLGIYATMPIGRGLAAPTGGLGILRWLGM